jgi:three-Cys-motif partner protein
MKSRIAQTQNESAFGHGGPLFPDFKPSEAIFARRYKRINQPIWAESKARFIQQYLRLFVQVTRHGTYIDGFAGPQYIHKPDAWAAALVLAGEPKWLQHFFLCEISPRKLISLRKLVGEQPIPRDRNNRRLPRKIELLPGDFNLTVDMILTSGGITQKEATFCLLDQHTFECKWATLQKLATYKNPPHRKIELLYFLGVGWLHRAFKGIKRPQKHQEVADWWGKDWSNLKAMSEYQIAELLRGRFKDELGYLHTAAYLIYDRNRGNRIMYYMIHASDHDEAPALMVRAHSQAVRATIKEVQHPLFKRGI